MKSILQFLVILAVLTSSLAFTPPAGVQGAACTWNGSTGSWSDATKWDCHHVPGLEDDAILTMGNLSVDGDVQVKSFTQTNGNLLGASTLSAGTVNWSGGWMRGAGATTALTAANFTGSAILSLDGRTFNNAGILTHNLTGSGYLYLYAAESVFNNLAGATYRVDKSWTKVATGPGTFHNDGHIIKTSADASAQFSTTLINSATSSLEVENGILQVWNAAGGTSSGGFRILPGATISLAGVKQALTGTIAVTGSGTLEITAEVDLDGALTLAEGTLSLPYNGKLNLTTAGTSVNTAILSQAGGLLNGPGSLTAYTINWSQGNMTGSGITTATHDVNITGTSPIYLDGRTFNNAGTCTWNRTSYLQFLTAGSVFNNQAGATFTVQSSSIAFLAGTGVFNNAGTLTIHGPTGRLTLGSGFTNTGQVNVETGMLDIISPAQSSPIGAGNYNVSSGATLKLNGASMNVTGDVSIAGEGDVILAATLNLDGHLTRPSSLTFDTGGTLNLSTAGTTATVGTLIMPRGTLTGPGDLTAGIINWSGGTMSGSGSTTATDEVNFTGTTTSTLDGRTFNNVGTATWNRTGTSYLYFLSGGVFNNLPGATFTVQNAEFFVTNGTGVFNNSGTLNLTKGGFTIGTFNQTAGGVTNLAISGETVNTDYTRFETTQSNLAGALNVTFTGGYLPEAGDRFHLMIYSTRTGDFSPLNLQQVGDLHWVQGDRRTGLIIWAASGFNYLPLMTR